MTNNARIGGILSIVGGGLGAIGALVMVFFAIIMGIFGTSFDYSYSYDYDYYGMENFMFVMAAIYGVVALIGLLVCALAIIGGIYGIKRKNWGLALAGSIAAAVAFFPCGIAAIIFTVLGKPEFNGALPAAPAAPQI